MFASGIALLAFSEILDRVRASLPDDLEIFLVGGAIRDALLSRPTHDLDFVLARNAAATARAVANRMGGAFFVLDHERDIARVLIGNSACQPVVMDFSAFRGPDLESDLRGRDFSINAMAVGIHQPQTLLDPLGGAQDLYQKVLRTCSQVSLQEDPLRILRGVRLAVAFNLHILPETRLQMRQAVRLLESVSPERVRDELFRILDGPQPALSLRTLDLLDVFPQILPELQILKGVSQSPPHVFDAWNHTLAVLQNLDMVLKALIKGPDSQGATNWLQGTISLRLGRYRSQINEHFQMTVNAQRSLRALLFLAALYHDSGKPATRQVEETGRIRFFEHERVGTQITGLRADALRLSNEERRRLESIVCHHLRPGLLAQSPEGPTRLAIYHFFRDAGPAGVDICLLSLADVMATYGPGLPQDHWIHHLDVVRELLEAYWERPQEVISPPALVDGNDLLRLLGISPGPQVGQLLEAIREGQASGQVSDREAALNLARNLCLDRNEP